MPVLALGTGQVGSYPSVGIDPTANAVDTVKVSAAAFRGGTITQAATSQVLMTANAARRGYTFQNQSTDYLYIKVANQATLDFNSLRLAPSAIYETPPHHVSTAAIYIIGPTAGQAFYATEF